jgi:photosystem II stability/assembly factor-like uncharacterized protein
MIKKRSQGSYKKKDRAFLEVNPRKVLEGDTIIIMGSGWDGCPVKIEFDRKSIKPIRLSQGIPVPQGVLPDATGNFVVTVSTFNIKPGKHRITVTSTHRRRKIRASESLEISERPHYDFDLEPEVGKEDMKEMAYNRSLDFFNRRFKYIGFIPPGTREIQINQIRNLRERRDRMRQKKNLSEDLFEEPEPSPPVPMVCNWTPVGAGPVPKGQTEGSPTQPIAGRTISIAIDPVTPGRVYIGTAGGGVWKSIDNGVTWSPKTDYNMSMAIGSLAIDPNNNLRIFAGTGEYHHTSTGGLTYYGNGILRSEDGGETWTELATNTLERDEISRILFDPTDPTSQRMFLSSATGVYESTSGGTMWSQLRAGSASDLVLIVDPVLPQTIKLIGSFYGSGLWTSTRTGTSWSNWTQITDTTFPTNFDRIAMGQSKNNPNTIYVIFAKAYDSGIAIVKTTDAGSSWAPVTVRLNKEANGATMNTLGHAHSLTIPASDLIAPPVAHSYTTSSSSPGPPPHTHTFTLAASEIQELAGGNRIYKQTDPDATGHQHYFLIKTIAQTWYNLHIAVHPNDTNIIYFGEIRLWKNTSGGGVFNDITDGEPVGPPPPGVPIGIHVDQHAFAFDPSNSDIVWACNDGGVYRSENGGQTWSHRNRDLATLQYMHVSSHPQWEAVMLGGTQDNGTHRYSGNPAWEFSAYGDGGFTAIDPNNPTRMYHGYVRNIFYRSDSAGALGTWTLKKGAITGDPEFYPPFTLDPSNPDVCYFGNNKLWRSPDNADNWSAITNVLTGNITAIAVHPTDSTTIYLGTSQGSVYRVQKTGSTWTLADVTTTDLTGPDLPSGLYISDLAVDTAGTVWVTFSSVTWTESTGEFTNNHVYRRLSGGNSWETRSNGLAQANPINTIVIDPTNSNRLFCGGDLGVFRTEDAGGMWTAWDEGLPNVPVFHLEIHNPLRLMRAATHGRSVWERPIDVAMCPMVDLYIRDNILDTGRVLPSPDHQPHPFDPNTLVHHWESVDIKVDAMEGQPPEFQTASHITDYVAFESDLQHRTARRGEINRFYVQLHNRGVNKATNVQARGFFAEAHAGLPPLPSDFWSGGKPFTGTPLGTDWTPIGPTQTISVLEPAEPAVVEWDWLVPTTAHKHSCLLALSSCAEDPLAGTGIFNADYLVLNRKHVALKNLHVEDAVMGMPLPPEEAYIIYFRAPYQRELVGDVVFHWGSLPKETVIFVAFEIPLDKKPVVMAKAGDLKRNGITLARQKRRLFQDKVEGRCGDIKRFDMRRIYQLSQTKERSTTIPLVRIPYERSLAMAINIVLPKNMKEQVVQFDVMLNSGSRTIGGSTYILRPGKK